jgi:NTP pyrophosphatase (non-canonical NTP hydrolase)
MRRRPVPIPEDATAIDRRIPVQADALAFVTRCLRQKFYFKETQLFHYLVGEVKELVELDAYTIYLPYEIMENKEKLLQDLIKEFLDIGHWAGIHIHHRGVEWRTSPHDVVQINGKQVLVPYMEPNPMRTNIIFFKEKSK